MTRGIAYGQALHRHIAHLGCQCSPHARHSSPTQLAGRTVQVKTKERRGQERRKKEKKGGWRGV